MNGSRFRNGDSQAFPDHPASSLFRSISRLYAHEIQFSIASMMAKYYEGRESYTILSQDGDIDIVIPDKRGREPLAGFEVEMGKLGEDEVRKATFRIYSNGIKKAGTISLTSIPVSGDKSDVCLDQNELVEIATGVKGGRHS